MNLLSNLERRSLKYYCVYCECEFDSAEDHLNHECETKTSKDGKAN